MRRMSVKGRLAPQNNFLEKLGKKFDGSISNFVLGNAQEHRKFPIVYCSDGFSSLTGYSRNEIMGKSCDCSFLYGSDTESIESTKVADALSNNSELKTEIKLYKKNGNSFWCLLDVMPIKNEAGQIVLFLVSHKDISNQRINNSSTTALNGHIGDMNGSVTQKTAPKLRKFSRDVLLHLQRQYQGVATRPETDVPSKRFPPSSMLSNMSRKTSLMMSYYKVKNHGSESPGFSRSVEQKASFFNSFLLPLSIPSNPSASHFKFLQKGMARKLTVATESTYVPQYKLEETKLPKLMLLHFGRPRIIWDWLILLIVAYIAITVPYNVAFKSHDRFIALFVMDIIFEIIFIVDIIINFRTTYIDKVSGRLISQPKKIAIHYLKGWFLIDLMAAMPFELLYFSKHSWGYLVSLLKCGRLLRLFRVARRISRYIEYTATLLVLMMVSFALLAHWLACVWYVIGHTERKRGSEIGWLFTLGDQLGKPYRNASNSQHGPNRGEAYISSLYFILTSLTTVGFGNIAPNTVAEKCFSVLLLLLGAMVQSAIFGNMTAVIQKLYAARARFHSKASQIKQFVRLHRLDGDLRRRIEDWFITHWSLSKGVNTEEMLSSFPTELQADICLHLYRSFLSLPCFVNASRGCLRALSLRVRRAHFGPGEVIIKEKDAINSIFFVERGTIEIVQKDCIVAILGSGDIFGEDISQMKNIRRANGDARALMYTEVLFVTRENLRDVLKSYPEFAVEFSMSLELTFDLSLRLKKSQEFGRNCGLGSITEEHEDAQINEESDTPISYSDTDSRGSDTDDNESIASPGRLPLWQRQLRYSSAQNSINRSEDGQPSPLDALKKRLLMMESMSQSEDDPTCLSKDSTPLREFRQGDPDCLNENDSDSDSAERVHRPRSRVLSSTSGKESSELLQKKASIHSKCSYRLGEDEVPEVINLLENPFTESCKIDFDERELVDPDQSQRSAGMYAYPFMVYVNQNVSSPYSDISVEEIMMRKCRDKRSSHRSKASIKTNDSDTSSLLAEEESTTNCLDSRNNSMSSLLQGTDMCNKSACDTYSSKHSINRSRTSLHLDITSSPTSSLRDVSNLSCSLTNSQPSLKGQSTEDVDKLNSLNSGTCRHKHSSLKSSCACSTLETDFQRHSNSFELESMGKTHANEHMLHQDQQFSLLHSSAERNGKRAHNSDSGVSFTEIAQDGGQGGVDRLLSDRNQVFDDSPRRFNPYNHSPLLRQKRFSVRSHEHDVTTDAQTKQSVCLTADVDVSAANSESSDIDQSTTQNLMNEFEQTKKALRKVSRNFEGVHCEIESMKKEIETLTKLIKDVLQSKLT